MRLLIVEDAPRLRATLGQALTRMGHAVDLAQDGAEGDLMGRTTRYDVVVLDRMMPGKDGLEVLLEGNELTIIGRRTPEAAGVQLLYRESSDRDYRRTFELDPAIDTGRINAKMDNGILFLELPKSEKVKPRKITVE